MKTDLTLKTRDGGTTSATAEWFQRAAPVRIGMAVGLGVGGFVLGAASIVIPVAHLVTTWALPLSGLVAAWWTWRGKGRLTDLRGTCPACGGDVQRDPGAVEVPMWERCNHCNAPLELVLPQLT